MTPEEVETLAAHPWAEELFLQRDAAVAERDRLRAHVLDICAHATPYGDLPDEPGYTGVYLLTAGALHRALGTVGHTAPSCQAEAERDAAIAERDRLARVLEEARSVADQAMRAGDTTTVVAAWMERDALREQRDDARDLLNAARAENTRLKALVRGVEAYGTGFVWLDPATGRRRVLDPADVMTVLPAGQLSEIERLTAEVDRLRAQVVVVGVALDREHGLLKRAEAERVRWERDAPVVEAARVWRDAGVCTAGHPPDLTAMGAAQLALAAAVDRAYPEGGDGT